MKTKLVLLASYFVVVLLFLCALIIHQLFLLGQNSRVSAKSINTGTNVEYKALPDFNLETKVELLGKEARVEIVSQFFARYKSPLLDYAKTIVETADKYSVDYRLLPAIAMQESTLCKKMPVNSFNCWGFGIYGKKVTRFSSFEEAIETVTKTLARDYHGKGLTDPQAIMTKYTPSNSGVWAENVSYIIDRISLPL